MSDKFLIKVANIIVRMCSPVYRIKANEITARGHAEFLKARGEECKAVSWDEDGYVLSTVNGVDRT